MNFTKNIGLSYSIELCTFYRFVSLYHKVKYISHWAPNNKQWALELLNSEYLGDIYTEISHLSVVFEWTNRNHIKFYTFIYLTGHSHFIWCFIVFSVCVYSLHLWKCCSKDSLTLYLSHCSQIHSDIVFWMCARELINNCEREKEEKGPLVKFATRW